MASPSSLLTILISSLVYLLVNAAVIPPPTHLHTDATNLTTISSPSGIKIRYKQPSIFPMSAALDA